MARLLFQPIEEVSRTMFAKLIAAEDAADGRRDGVAPAPGTVIVRSVRAAP